MQFELIIKRFRNCWMVIILRRDILVVDDQIGIQILLEDVLTSKGFGVRKAGTGVEALKLLGESVADVMILDYQLPVMNGSELIRRLKEYKCTMPIILMSGNDNDTLKKYTEELSVKAIFTKPFNMGELCETIERILV